VITDNESCESCRYWNRDSGVDGEPDECGEFHGTCRRYPPVSVLNGEEDDVLDEDGKWLGRNAHSFIYWTQPRTVNTEWCGEYAE
jgi:hypothetical protein